MGKLKRLTMLLAVVLPAVAGQAQTVDICDRTPQVRDALLEAVDADDCAAVNSESLAGVETLNLPSKQLTALRAGDFNGLASLQRLYLGGNQLTTLPDGVFDGLTSLVWLSLNGNQLTTLPDGVFDGLDSLQSLYLGGNRLTALPDGVFDGLARLYQTGESVEHAVRQDKETTMLAETLREWDEQKIDEGRREGRREGQQEGRQVLCSLAGRRFGADTGDELAALLAGVADGAELERIGTLIIDCGNGPDFLARARTR